MQRADGMYYMDHRWDFSGARYIVLDVHNPENSTFTLGIALQVTDNWRWKELTNVSVRPGTHTVVLDLSEYAEELYQVMRINICYREDVPMNGRFYVDNLRIIK